jgi:peptidoglycan/xylan/chitin deacetylase (PgdA/CDA1 family)
MLKDGYQYFDWDVSSGDAAGASRQGIYNNVVNGAKSCSRCIVLMHDIKPNTANELDNILKTLTERGYKFATLDINSPTVHHKIAN